MFPNFWQALSLSLSLIYMFQLEVFTEDPRPEDPGPDPGPVRIRVYILNGQPGPGRVPIYYFGSQVFLTYPSRSETPHPRVISVSQHACVWLAVCKIRMRKVWAGNKVKKKNTRYLSRQKQSARGVNVVLQADADHEWCGKKAETKLKRRTCYWTRTQ